MLAFGLGSLATALDYRGDYQERYPSYAESSANPESDLSHGKSAVGATQQKTPCQNPQGHNESDLCAQWRSANAAKQAAEWAFWQLVLSGFGIFGLLVTLWFNARAINVASISAQEAGRAADAAHDANRPWLEFTINRTGNFHLSKDGADFQADINLFNRGNSPATNVVAYMRLMVFSNESGILERAAETKQAIVKALHIKDARREMIGITIFPNAHPTEESAKDETSSEDIAKARGDPPGDIAFHLAIGVRYRFGSRFGYTANVYALGMDIWDFDFAEGHTKSITPNQIELVDCWIGYAT